MNLNDVLTSNQNTMDKYAAFWSKQSQFSSGAAKISQGKYSLKRLKMKAGDGLMVVPLMIHLPIDYSGKPTLNPMPYVGSFDTVISVIKNLANNNTMYKEALAGILGDQIGELNFADIASVTQEERKVFWRFRHPLVYQKTVMSVKAANSPNQFGTTYAVDIATDPETGDFIDDPTNPAIWTLHNLETECIASQVKDIRATNEGAGNARRTEQAIQQEISSLWQNRIISNPYSLGTTRVLFFDANKDYVIDPDITKKWTADDSGIRANEYYTKISKKILEKIEDIIGSKYDRYADFLLLKQNTPTFDEKTRGTAAQQISRMAASSDEKIEDMLHDFIEAYSNYRNNLDMWDEKVIKSSAFEYRTISDKNIQTIFKNSMGALAAFMNTQEIYSKYSETIAALDSQLSDEIIANSMIGSGLREIGDISAEVAAAPVVSENTPGYGGDTADDIDDTEAMAAALRG